MRTLHNDLSSSYNAEQGKQILAKTLIVTPMKKEFSVLSDYLSNEGHAMKNRADKVQAAWLPDFKLLIAVAGHGKAMFAATTQYLVDRHGPFALIMAAGTAGALHGALRPGDVVLATETVEHDYKSRFAGHAPPPRHACCPVARKGILNTYGGDGTFRLHVGAIASGDEDIVDPKRARQLQQETDALCVAWEGAGGARAARFNGIPFIEVRAVTDAADASAPESFCAHLEQAVSNIARVLLPWLRSRRIAKNSGC